MSNLLLFITASATILGTPGPTNTLLATSGALVGIRRSLPLIPTELAGYGCSITALASLGAIALSAFPKLGVSIRICVAIYLLFLAWRLWSSDAVRTTSGTITPLRVFITTLLNPKALIFAFVVFPPISTFEQAILHASVFAILLTMFIATGWIVAGASMGRIAGRGGDLLISRIAAVALVGFACALAGTTMAG